MYQRDLIYDVGMHTGEDTSFYLAKGFRVVAVEAAPDLARRAEQKFADELSNGRLILVSSAIAAKRGPVDLFLNPTSEWNTTDPDWAASRLALRTGELRRVTVPGVSFGDLLVKHGTPYFLKVDIEGSDMMVLQTLTQDDVPKFLSIESCKTSWAGLVHEFDVLQSLGYRRFMVVAQHKVVAQVPPYPPREGRYITWEFEHMASGLFGHEAPGRWLTAAAALAKYRAIFARYWLYGDEGRLPSRIGLHVSKIFGWPGWFDTHATF